MGRIEHVVKRSGAVVPFTPERITNAIYRAAVAVGGRDRVTAEQLSRQVIDILEKETPANHTPTIEEIQDIVEKVLIDPTLSQGIAEERLVCPGSTRCDDHTVELLVPDRVRDVLRDGQL